MGKGIGAPGPAGHEVRRTRAECRVLVIDDNMDAADTVAMFLESEGFSVAVGYCGEDAFREAAAAPIDVAVLDIGLPDMNGYQLAEAMRGPNDVPLLIAVTGWGAQADIDRALKAGFDFHFTKPAPLPELLALIDERCMGRPTRRLRDRGRELRPRPRKTDD